MFESILCRIESGKRREMNFCSNHTIDFAVVKTKQLQIRQINKHKRQNMYDEKKNTLCDLNTLAQDCQSNKSTVFFYAKL